MSGRGPRCSRRGGARPLTLDRLPLDIRGQSPGLNTKMVQGLLPEPEQQLVKADKPDPACGRLGQKILVEA